jgi:hypothetical protein
VSASGPPHGQRNRAPREQRQPEDAGARVQAAAHDLERSRRRRVAWRIEITDRDTSVGRPTIPRQRLRSLGIRTGCVSAPLGEHLTGVPGRFARSRERDARHGRPPTRRPGSAGCRAAALVGLRHLQEVADAPDDAIWCQEVRWRFNSAIVCRTAEVSMAEMAPLGFQLPIGRERSSGGN